MSKKVKVNSVSITIGIIIISLSLLLNAYFAYSFLQERANDVGFHTAPLSTIFIDAEVQSFLKEYYEGATVEFLFCAYGTDDDSTLTITRLENVGTYNQTTNIVEVGECRKKPGFDLLGMIHSHPLGICQAHNQDYYTFGDTNYRFFGIICEPDRMVFYTPHTLNTGINIEVIS